MKNFLIMISMILISFLSVSQITINETITNVSCYGLNNGKIEINVLGGNPPYKYTWKDSKMNIISNNQNIYDLKSQVYYIYIVDSKGKTSQKTLSISQPSTILYIKGAAYTPVCSGPYARIDLTKVEGGTKPYYYNWSNGSTNQNIKNLSDGLYKVIVRDNNGCTKSDSFNITLPKKLTLTSKWEEKTCFNEKVEIKNSAINGNLPYIFKIYDKNNQEIKTKEVYPGFYRVRVYDSKGCTDETNGFFQIKSKYSEIKPMVDIIQPTNNGKTGVVTILGVSGGLSPYTIIFDGKTSKDNIFKTKTGDFDLVIKDNAKCEYKEKIYVNTRSKRYVKPFELDSVTKINDEIILGQNYPNPVSFNTIIGYKVPLDSKSYIHVFTNLGFDALVIELNPNDNQIEIDKNMLNSGFYNYKLVVDNKIISIKKMIIE